MTTYWTEFGLRNMPPMSGRTRPESLSPLLKSMVDAVHEAVAQPLVGVTTDGSIRPGLFTFGPTGVSTGPIVEAAQAFLQVLTAEQRERTTFPLDSDERRMWFNIHPNVFRHGLLLEELSEANRNLACEIMATTLSARGFQQARDVMRLNGLLIDITGSADQFGEWPYFFSIFGTPSADQPWGWQIDGHHLNLNCTVLGDQVVFTPSFMGSEPCHVTEGRLAGTEVFRLEERAGLDLIRSLDAAQLGRAVTRPSILPADLPKELQHPIDGRMVAGAFKDNAVIPYEGIRGDALSDAQRRLLIQLIGTYVGWANDEHGALKMREVQAHLDKTHFSWMGATGDEGPFYYRVHSPVVLIEFDHHPGIVFDNLTPSRHHVHSILRTPNGGDYGVDLLRQHYDRFDHGTGHHH